MTRIADSSYGELHFDGNELSVRSLIDDPPKVRLEAPPGSLSKGLVTWGTRRPDGRFEELALFQGKQDERVRDDPLNFTGEIDVFVRRHDPNSGDDRQFLRVLTIRHDGVQFHVPVTVQAAPTSFLRSHDGRFELHMQGDGNLVVYDTAEPTWRAIWSSNSVVAP
jgi:hypothetical protein